MDRCDLKSGTCETTGSSGGAVCSSAPCQPKCECGGACGGDPVVCAMLVWKCAFGGALREVMVDMLKARIQKTMGSKLEKSADAVMEAMMVKWQAKMSEVEAKADLKDKLREIMSAGK